MPARRSPTSHLNVSGLHRAARRMALLLLSGLAIVSVMPAVTMAQSLAVAPGSASNPYAAHITEAATRFRLPAVWIRAVMRVESRGDVRAISLPGYAADAVEIGDLLFAICNVARFLKVDPESALREANRRFGTRFRRVEQQAEAQGRRLADMTLDEMDVLWERAKAEERGGA